MKDPDLISVRQCLSGNIQAFEKLVDQYQRPIFRLAFRMIGNFDDAEEIAQIAFVKAYESLKSYNPKYKFFSWLYRIAINEAINYKKKVSNKNELNPDIESSSKSPEMMMVDTDMSERIQDALMSIDLIYREPVVLKHFLNYSYKELSNILEIPEKTVKSRLYTGRQLLKEILLKNQVL